MTEPDASRLTFLPLADAAAMLGVSRLKLREAIAKGLLPAQRDNQGHWRVDLTAAPTDLRAETARHPAAPDALMTALFDEIDQLSAEAEAATATHDRLLALAGAQATALDRAMAAVAERTAERDRFAALTARALQTAAQAAEQAGTLQASAQRAKNLAHHATRALEAAQAEARRQHPETAARDIALESQAEALDRLFFRSEQALNAAAQSRAAPGLIARVFARARPTS